MSMACSPQALRIEVDLLNRGRKGEPDAYRRPDRGAVGREVRRLVHRQLDVGALKDN